MVAYGRTVVELKVSPELKNRILNYVGMLFEKRNGVYKKWCITDVKVKNTPEYHDFILVFTAFRMDNSYVF